MGETAGARTKTDEMLMPIRATADGWHVVIRENTAALPQAWMWEHGSRKWLYRRQNYRSPVEAWRSGWRLVCEIPAAHLLRNIAFVAGAWATAQERGDQIPGRGIGDATSLAALAAIATFPDRIPDFERLLQDIRRREMPA